MRAKLFVTEALRSVTSNLSTTVAATMTVLIGMFLLGLFIALGTWVLSWTNNVEGRRSRSRSTSTQDANAGAEEGRPAAI